MAVFTAVDSPAFADWAARAYGFCRVSPLAGIGEGIENTNYRFEADGKPYVFTIFEVWDASAAEYYAALMRHFAGAGLPAPAPVFTADGRAALSWEGKPCVVVPFASGAAKTAPTPADCRRIGGLLADLHRAAGDFAPRRPNPRGADWRRAAAEKIRPMLDGERRELLAAAISRDAEFCQAPLPAAACHCDLFRNNVLWEGDEIAAVIDFYFGGEDSLIFDLAVCACDWGGFSDGEFSAPHLRALAAGYGERRRLTDLEKRLFADALTAAAARFWLSRQYDVFFPRAARRLTPHDPAQFERILRRAMAARDDIGRLLAEAA